MGNIRHELSADKTGIGPARLLYVTASLYDNDWPSIMHSHYFAEFFYIIGGEGKFTIEDSTAYVKENDLIMINPRVSHAERSLSQPLDYIVLGVDGLAFAFDSQSNRNYAVINCRKKKNVFLHILQTLLSESKQKEDGYTDICSNYFNIFMIYLKRISTLEISLPESDYIPPECSRVKAYIDSNLSKSITLDSLSEIAHINKYYLSHCFIKAYGVSPINYLIEQRIRCGKELLESTNYSVAQVTQSTGFSSQSYFAACFKKHTGLSPSAYRKKAGGTK